MIRILRSLFGPKAPRGAFRNQLSFPAWPAAVYAVGDVHGCLDQLRALEQLITTDGEAIAGEKLIVTLGDYVDRGPDSAGVIEHLMRPLPHDFERVLLGGNHEELMLNAIKGLGDETWLEFGGVETIRSYGIDVALYRSSRPKARQTMLQSHIPQDHLSFLEGLALSLQLGQTVFAHAGIKRNIPIAQQNPNDLVWIRREFLDASPTDGLLVVHGHTPASEPELAPGRIGIDTCAFSTGRLTAVRLIEGATPDLFTTRD